MLFDFNYFLRMFEIIASGFKNTLSLSVISLFLSVILGFVLAGVRYYNVPVLKQISVVFTSFFRSTPFIAQLFVFYYRSKISRNYWLFEPKCRNNAEITYTQRLQIASYFP